MPVGVGQRDRFGDLLRILRRSRGLTQEDLAEASGSSVRTIREMERGRVRTPQRRTAALLADALGLAGGDRARFLDLARTDRPDRPPIPVLGAPPETRAAAVALDGSARAPAAPESAVGAGSPEVVPA